MVKTREDGRTLILFNDVEMDDLMVAVSASRLEILLRHSDGLDGLADRLGELFKKLQAARP